VHYRQSKRGHLIGLALLVDLCLRVLLSELGVGRVIHCELWVFFRALLEMAEPSKYVQPAIPKFDGHYDHWAK